MRLIIIGLLVSFHSVGFTAKMSDEASEKMERLFACGADTENGFNGWMIHGLDENVNTYFDFNQLEFYTHEGGFYQVSITKKLDQMVGFSDLSIQTAIAESNNCNIENITAQVSADGKEWVYLQENLLHESALLCSNKMNFQFLKLSSNISFSRNGRVRVGAVKVYGSTTYHKLKLKSLNETQESEMSNSHQNTQEDFHFFSHDKQLHIETQSDDAYLLEIYNSKGLKVKKSIGLGSERFDVSHLQDGIYFVVIKQKNKAMITKKVAF